jgi:undecaprenyl-diphosphatase
MRTTVQERAPTGWSRARMRRRLGRRSLLAAVGGLLVAVPLTLLTVLVLNQSRGLQEVDQGLADDLHAYVSARPDLAGLLGLVSVVTHPIVMRVAATALALRLWRIGQRRQAVWLATATLLGSLLDPLLKEVVARARPAFDDPVALAPGYSFPSGHALQSMLFAACVLVVGHGPTRGRPRARALLWAAAVALVLVTGFDRVALGVHYTSDVVAGWTVALATLCVTLAAFHTEQPFGGVQRGDLWPEDVQPGSDQRRDHRHRPVRADGPDPAPAEGTGHSPREEHP